MRRLLLLLGLGLGAVIVVAGAAVYLMWDLDWRFRPHTITKRQAEIAQALEQAGWVSPHLTGPKLYVVLNTGCQACGPLAATVPKLQAADVDTRMVLIAPADRNGQALSTAQDRALVAELWTNRSWKLFQQWSLANPSSAWTAPGVPPADGDAARTAVVGAGGALVAALTPELKDNGLAFAYPTVVWWTKDGKMRACVCADPRSYRFVEKDLEQK